MNKQNGLFSIVGILGLATVIACSVGGKNAAPGATENPADGTQEPGDGPADPGDTSGDPVDPTEPEPVVPVPADEPIIDPDTGKPVPQDITPEVLAEFGFTLTLPADARVTKNGIVERCFYEGGSDPVVTADAGAPVQSADAGAPAPEPEPVPVTPPVRVCVNQYELVWQAYANGALYDMNIYIDPVDDGRNPLIVALATEGAGGTLVIADNIQGGSGTSGWITNATALRPASNGLNYQFQLNGQLGNSAALAQSVFREVLATFRIRPIAK